jgi:hypothetical protein
MQPAVSPWRSGNTVVLPMQPQSSSSRRTPTLEIAVTARGSAPHSARGGRRPPRTRCLVAAEIPRPWRGAFSSVPRRAQPSAVNLARPVGVAPDVTHREHAPGSGKRCSTAVGPESPALPGRARALGHGVASSAHVACPFQVPGRRVITRPADLSGFEGLGCPYPSAVAPRESGAQQDPGPARACSIPTAAELWRRPGGTMRACRRRGIPRRDRARGPRAVARGAFGVRGSLIVVGSLFVSTVACSGETWTAWSGSAVPEVASASPNETRSLRARRSVRGTAAWPTVRLGSLRLWSRDGGEAGATDPVAARRPRSGRGGGCAGAAARTHPLRPRGAGLTLPAIYGLSTPTTRFRAGAFGQTEATSAWCRAPGANGVPSWW